MTIERDCADGGPLTLAGPAAADSSIALYVALPLRNESLSSAYIAAVSDPNSPYFRQYLSSDQIAALFLPTTCDYDALIAWGQGKGFTVTGTYDNRLAVDFSAPISAADTAFHVTLGEYGGPDGGEFLAPDVDPSIDLAVPVAGVAGLDDCPPREP